MSEGGGESYELGPVHAAAPAAARRFPVAQLVMPDRYHRALDAFLQGRGGSQDSDSDMSSDDGGGVFTDRYGPDARTGRRDSLESLMREKKAREGSDDDDDNGRDRDVEAQPAWMRSRYTSGNNVLRVCGVPSQCSMPC